MRVDETRSVTNPGRYKDRGSLQRKDVTSQDSYGQDVYSWTDYHTCRARVTALAGREFDAAQQKWAEARFKVEMPYVAGVEREHCFHWHAPDRFLDILDAEKSPFVRNELVLICRELTR